MFKLYPLELHTSISRIYIPHIKKQFHNRVCSFNNTGGITILSRFLSQDDERHDTGFWKFGDEFYDVYIITNMFR